MNRFNLTIAMGYYILRLAKQRIDQLFSGRCTVLTAGKSKYPILIYWIIYGVINYCEPIETTFELVTFVV